MTEQEKVFVEKFNDMLVAAKELEKEGIYHTGFTVELASADKYQLDRQKLINEIDGRFLTNGYKLTR